MLDRVPLESRLAPFLGQPNWDPYTCVRILRDCKVPFRIATVRMLGVTNKKTIEELANSSRLKAHSFEGIIDELRGEHWVMVYCRFHIERKLTVYSPSKKLQHLRSTGIIVRLKDFKSA